MPPAYDVVELRNEYHRAVLDWQEKNFPEYELLVKNWGKYFGDQTPFRMVAKIGKMKSDMIELGEYQGRPKYTSAGEMVGNMFYSARNIIRAQCSTELGSIQQHRLTLDAAVSDQAKYSVMRIMAEELRHAYQMFWVLDHDSTWDKPGHGNIAKDTIEELLAMTTGTHVLDAFNIEFRQFLDNVTFATIIDLVGKYQLEMQRVFSYAPMAKSMQPMLSEEGFHMATGRNTLKEIALASLEGKGKFSIQDMQKSLNQWLARGLEMFGNETAGVTAVHFGFKDKTNGQAQQDYYNEVKSIYEDINVTIVAKRLGLEDREAVRKIVREIDAEKKAVQGVKYEDILHAPHIHFFRRRGLPEYTFKPVDIDGNSLKENGKPVSNEAYFQYLTTALPNWYVTTQDFENFKKSYAMAQTQTVTSGFMM